MLEGLSRNQLASDLSKAMKALIYHHPIDAKLPEDFSSLRPPLLDVWELENFHMLLSVSICTIISSLLKPYETLKFASHNRHMFAGEISNIIAFETRHDSFGKGNFEENVERKCRSGMWCFLPIVSLHRVIEYILSYLWRLNASVEKKN